MASHQRYGSTVAQFYKLNLTSSFVYTRELGKLLQDLRAAVIITLYMNTGETSAPKNLHRAQAVGDLDNGDYIRYRTDDSLFNLTETSQHCQQHITSCFAEAA